MDQRRTKRPRSSTPTKGKGGSIGGVPLVSGESPTKKKSKSKDRKTKNKNRNRSNSDATSTRKTGGGVAGGSHGGAGGGSSTATADGEMMMTLLSTFSKVEQSRFEAYQRCSLDNTVVSEWLAACISDRYGLLRGTTTSSGPSSTGENVKIRPLEDLVAAGQGQADDIAMVVGTLGKIYAQRLVSTALKMKQQSEAAMASAATVALTSIANIDTNNNTAVTSTNTTESTTNGNTPINPSNSNNEPTALQPQDIIRAWERRQREGLDPGFFLQAQPALQTSLFDTSVVSISGAGVVSTAAGGRDGGCGSAAAGGIVLKERDARRLAAIAAQNTYDKHMEKVRKEQVEKEEEEERKRQLEEKETKEENEGEGQDDREEAEGGKDRNDNDDNEGEKSYADNKEKDDDDDDDDDGGWMDMS